jgi:hypothetical protein
MTAIIGALTRAHLFINPVQLLSKNGRATGHLLDPSDPQAEGWDVFDCGFRDDGTPRVELQRLDSPARGTPAFRDDKDAWEHVVRQARAGSRPHQRALQMLDPFERFAIEAACGWCPGL